MHAVTAVTAPFNLWIELPLLQILFSSFLCRMQARHSWAFNEGDIEFDRTFSQVWELQTAGLNTAACVLSAWQKATKARLCWISTVFIWFTTQLFHFFISVEVFHLSYIFVNLQTERCPNDTWFTEPMHSQSWSFAQFNHDEPAVKRILLAVRLLFCLRIIVFWTIY